MVDATIKGHNGRTVPHPLRIKGPVNGWMIKDQDSPLGQTLWHHGEVEEGKIGCRVRLKAQLPVQTYIVAFFFFNIIVIIG